MSHEQAIRPGLLCATPDDLLRCMPSLGPAPSFCAVAIDECDAVLCGGPHTEAVTPAAETLLRGIFAHSRPQTILTTAHLTLGHDRALKRRFPSISRVGRPPAPGGGASNQQALVPTLQQVFHYVPPARAEGKLLDVINRADERDWLREGKILVCCRSADEALRIHTFLQAERAELHPALLHSRLDPRPRATALSAFADAGSRLLVCTADLVRGLHLPSVRHVIIADVSDDVADFVHCAGRTARGGETGLVSCIVTSGSKGGMRLGQHRGLHALQSAAKLDFARGG
jgi:superfamily II DNA/RNA helicase